MTLVRNYTIKSLIDRFKRVVSRFNKRIVSKPEKSLTWTVEDYQKGMRWAKSQPHPYRKGKTLWDLCYDKYESTYTIDNLNKFLFNEI